MKKPYFLIRSTYFLFIVILLSCKGGKTIKVDSDQLYTIGDSLTRIDEKTKEKLLNTNNSYVYHYGKTDLKGLQIKYTDTTGYAEISNKLFGFPQNWKEYRYLQFNVYNPSKANLKLVLAVCGNNSVLGDTVTLFSNNKVFYKLNLSDLPLTGDNTSIYEPTSLRFYGKSSISSFTIIITGLKLIISDITKPNPVIDQYGQRINASWRGKIRSVQYLKSKKSNEEKNLVQLNRQLQTDKFGGYVSSKKYKARGYFYVFEDRNKWWLISPQGNIFWSLGITNVLPADYMRDATVIRGREHIFQNIPERNGRFSNVFTPDGKLSYYAYNIIRKYGSLDAWYETLSKRFSNWKVNSIGHTLEKNIPHVLQFPYTKMFITTNNKKLQIKNGLCDYFNPEWENYTDSVLSKATKHKNDSFLIGYLVDSDINWNHLNLLSILPENAYGRFEWERILKRKYSWSLRNLNSAWETGYTNWDTIRNLKKINKRTILRDYLDFEEAFIEKYYKTISRTLKKYDPKHLLICSGNNILHLPDHIVSSLGKYYNILLVTIHNSLPDKINLTKIYREIGKPILVEGQNLPLASKKQLPAKKKLYTSKERSIYLQNFVKVCAEMPFIVGCHWKQFVDMPIIDNPSDGRNKIIGFVDVTDQPYEDMINAIRICGQSVYRWQNVPGN